MGPLLLGRPIEAIWHTSVVVYGKEWYFDGGVGIVAESHPGMTRFGTPYRQEVLGQTTKSETDFSSWVQQQLRTNFGPNDYNLLNNNCNHFTDAAVLYLLGRHTPEDLREMIPSLLSTPLGQMLRPMLEQVTSAGTTAASGHPSRSSPPPPPPPSSSVAASGISEAGDRCEGLCSTRMALSEEEEEELTLAQAMLESNEFIADGPHSSPEGFQLTLSCLTVVEGILQKVLDHPMEAKYRRISIQTRTYTEKVAPMEEYGIGDVLRLAGFEQRVEVRGGEKGSVWYLSDAEASEAVLRRVLEVVREVVIDVETSAAVAMSLRESSASAPTAPEVTPSVGAPAACTVPCQQASTHSAKITQGNKAVQNEAKAEVTPTPAPPLLQYCTPPFPADFVPLKVGREAGAPLFSILRDQAVDGMRCFGKCRLENDARFLEGHYCSQDGKEKTIHSGYAVLCVRRGHEGELMWVPATEAASAQRGHHQTFVFNGFERFGVVRAAYGGGVHPGQMEPSGRCVIPFGGAAVVVTESAEVLCEAALVPADLFKKVAALEQGNAFADTVARSSGEPIGSFDDLVTLWQRPVYYLRPHPLRRRACNRWKGSGAGGATKATGDLEDPDSTGLSAGSVKPRLLVCHDFSGGYRQSDARTFAYIPPHGTGATPGRISSVETAYTVSYWDRVDLFVYFSHHCISVPPREWIDSGHRRGVPVLGTVLTEGNNGTKEISRLVMDAKGMATIISRLVELCDVYGFDGYLLNFENSIPEAMAQRLIIFCTQLRKQLNRPTQSNEDDAMRPVRFVVWYDAVTAHGKLQYQNALTANNKPFFDCTDGIFTNYFWNPMHLTMTKAGAGRRAADVYVGVDVFGRSMYGGGRYNSHIAVEAAANAQLSVALFAPSWSAECEGHNSRETFLRADSRLWERMQESFPYQSLVFDTSSPTSAAASALDGLPVWSTFVSGTGYEFYINGRRWGSEESKARIGRSNGISGWCELSAEHGLPPFQYESSSINATARGAGAHLSSLTVSNAEDSFAFFSPEPFRLPAMPLDGGIHGSTSPAEWLYDKAWFGDRCFSVIVAPRDSVQVMRWHVHNAVPSPLSGLSLCIDIAYHESALGPSSAEVTSTGGGPRDIARGVRLTFTSRGQGPISVLLPESGEQTATEDVLAKFTEVPLQLQSSSSTAEAAEVPSTSQRNSGGRSWRIVRCELQRKTSEPLHLVSISVANLHRQRSMECCIGGVALSHLPHSTSAFTEPVQASTRDVISACDSQLQQDKRCISSCALFAAGPHLWPLTSTQLHRTKATNVAIVQLRDAKRILAEVATQYGKRSSIVVFATVRGTPGDVVQLENGDSSPLQSSGRTYLGQISVDPEDSTLSDGAVLTRLTIPRSFSVEEVYYYVIQSGH